jgi:hypothetical protein
MKVHCFLHLILVTRPPTTNHCGMCHDYSSVVLELSERSQLASKDRLYSVKLVISIAVQADISISS